MEAERLLVNAVILWTQETRPVTLTRMQRPLLGILILLAILAGIGAIDLVSGRQKREAAKAFLTEFSHTKLEDRRAVFERHFLKLDAAGLLDALEERYPLCHSQAHELGKVIFTESGGLTEAIEICRERCSGGCFHGVLMEAFSGLASSTDTEGHLELGDVRAAMRELCQSELVTAIHREGKCTHGVGHALAFVSGYNLSEALASCELFGDRRLEYYCAGGVFMEYDLVYGAAEARSGPLHYPCDTYAEFPSACYAYKAKHLMAALKTPEAYAAECAGLERFSRLGCFRGLGFLNISAVSRKPERLAEVCKFGTQDDKIICIEGAIERLADFGEEAPAAACRTLADAELTRACEDAIRHKAYSLDKSFELYFR